MDHDFLLLDRSASMGSQWVEAVSSINAYVQKLSEDKVDTGVTLAVFDTGPDGKISFDIIRDRIIPSTWAKVSETEVMPRGSTPLNDAVGRIISLANQGNYAKVAIIIMTDGQENSSRELSVQSAKNLLDDCRKRGWQVIFLGANFDNATQATSYGNLARQTVSASTANLSQTMRSTATKRFAYATTGKAMDYSDEEKVQASS